VIQQVKRQQDKLVFVCRKGFHLFCAVKATAEERGGELSSCSYQIARPLILTRCSMPLMAADG